MKAAPWADGIGPGTALKLQPLRTTAPAMIGTVRMPSAVAGCPPNRMVVSGDGGTIAAAGTRP